MIPVPERMKKLPVDEKGRVTPWFVAWTNRFGRPVPSGSPPDVGKPDFRVSHANAILDAVNFGWCWVCGSPLGAFKSFVSGSMCAVTRVSAEPPSHLECAEYSVKACPFLSDPSRPRRPKNLPKDGAFAEGAILRNPGVALIWTTKKYRLTPIDNGKNVLFLMGDPEHLRWFREGRQATRVEILQSIQEGLPTLRERAEKDHEIDKLDAHIARAMTLVPEAM